jgi:hypothetical protein
LISAKESKLDKGICQDMGWRRIVLVPKDNRLKKIVKKIPSVRKRAVDTIRSLVSPTIAIDEWGDNRSWPTYNNIQAMAIFTRLLNIMAI